MKRKYLIPVITVISLTIGFFVGYFTNADYSNANDNSLKRPISEIKRDVFNGSEKAYGELRTEFLEYSQENFLFWALFRANKFKDRDAYVDVYQILENSYNSNDYETFSLEGMDTLTKKIVVDYLKLAADSGILSADSLLNLKNENVVPR